MSDAKPPRPNPLREAQGLGQSIWLDYIRRDLLTGGGLKRLVDEDGLSGLTSNPAIFEKAIAGGTDYDDLLLALAKEGLSPEAIFERLAVRDIQDAADIMAPVYRRTSWRDGYVSLEVSPRLAHDTAGTVAEAKRLWQAVGRPNLMIKVPATPEGIPAIRELISAGINVNVTLLFSRAVYEQAAQAYIDGLEARHERKLDLSCVASVASLFVSRIDSAVDPLLEAKAKAKEKDTPAAAARLRGLMGKAAIANARLTYKRFGEMFSGQRWRGLLAKRAWPQRLLFGSTGTKNPAYSDVLYVDELIGLDTVNTLPPATLDAFRDHGRPGPTLMDSGAEAEEVMRLLAAEGISLHEVTDRLLVEGVQQFAEAYEKLVAAIAARVG